MTLLTHAKEIAERLPSGVGMSLSWVPFTFRLGWKYATTQRSIRNSGRENVEAFQERTLLLVQSLVRFAFNNVKFYRMHYVKHGFSPDDVRTYEDVKKIPIVTRSDLQQFDLSDRSSGVRGGFRANTGGTSGQPLEFMLDRHAFAREWAHMHHLWMSRGYRQTHVKLTFRGKRLGGDVLRYNAVHNEYVVNANASMESVVDAVSRLPRNVVIRWLHGYPSLIAEFAHAMASAPRDVLCRFRQGLYGVLLGSEFPAPAYRRVISETFSSNIVSWYGHSEMAILAREVAIGVYASYPTYGLAEAVPADDGNGSKLICTSLNNRVHPFIRYDTGDRVEPIASVGGSLTFRVREGRVGDFVRDRSGRKHSLTAIIFGRHHEAFSLARHVQVVDLGDGRIVLVVTPLKADVSVDELKAGFDLNDIDISVKLMVVDEPIRTAAGKILLKIAPSLLPGIE